MPTLKPYVLREINGIQVAIVGQAFPYTPIANPCRTVADWSFGIQDENLQKVVDKARAKGAQVVRRWWPTPVAGRSGHGGLDHPGAPA